VQKGRRPAFEVGDELRAALGRAGLDVVGKLIGRFARTGNHLYPSLGAHWMDRVGKIYLERESPSLVESCLIVHKIRPQKDHRAKLEQGLAERIRLRLSSPEVVSQLIASVLYPLECPVERRARSQTFPGQIGFFDDPFGGHARLSRTLEL
jgi:hypothetical protein